MYLFFPFVAGARVRKGGRKSGCLGPSFHTSAEQGEEMTNAKDDQNPRTVRFFSATKKQTKETQHNASSCDRPICFRCLPLLLRFSFCFALQLSFALSTQQHFFSQLITPPPGPLSSSHQPTRIPRATVLPLSESLFSPSPFTCHRRPPTCFAAAAFLALSVVASVEREGDRRRRSFAASTSFLFFSTLLCEDVEGDDRKYTAAATQHDTRVLPGHMIMHTQSRTSPSARALPPPASS